MGERKKGRIGLLTIRGEKKQVTWVRFKSNSSLVLSTKYSGNHLLIYYKRDNY
ncbi:hypothetical protein KYJ26_00520 [Bacillus sp. MCCB 382]|uniref:hypothetical protein n=1 Tax=Bacillus sp. MCCB 382 TaxID=2860197 RepID=UPI001C57407D|nr:hypothetical protein [Bacillus sp. MCCB 382]